MQPSPLILKDRQEKLFLPVFDKNDPIYVFDIGYHETPPAHAYGPAVRPYYLLHLIEKGKGIEVNTSGLDRCGDFLPGMDYLKLFRDLGGEIITVGSDAHAPDRVGQHIDKALDILRDIFGHVCTFQNRKPIFHKL